MVLKACATMDLASLLLLCPLDKHSVTHSFPMASSCIHWFPKCMSKKTRNNSIHVVSVLGRRQVDPYEHCQGILTYLVVCRWWPPIYKWEWVSARYLKTEKWLWPPHPRAHVCTHMCMHTRMQTTHTYTHTSHKFVKGDCLLQTSNNSLLAKGLSLPRPGQAMRRECPGYSA